MSNLTENRLRQIGALKEKLRSAVERGFTPIPTARDADEDEVRFGAAVLGKTCVYVECATCGKQYELDSYTWQQRHKRTCK